MTKLLGMLGACVLSCLVVPNAASATTITFSDLPSGNCNPLGGGTISSGEYNFDGNPSDSDMFACNADQIAQNTSPALINANLTSIITMTAGNGDAFDLQSFDAGSRATYKNVTLPYPIHASTGILVEGFLGNSLVASTSVSFTGLNFSTFILGNAFNKLTSARFTALGTSDSPEFVIDDINVGAASPRAVPEPSTWMVVVLGFGGIGAAVRRSRNYALAKA